jgi:FKBP-type peptidyl-prolyl cis-trans isomerase FkpA
MTCTAHRGSRGGAVALPAKMLALAVLVSACGSAPAPRPDDVTFAPQLNVNLDLMQRLPSGVYIRDLRTGAGGEARNGQQVAVHYVGWLPDGTQFDGVASPSMPVEFRLGTGQVIRGWDAGIIGMREGGQRMLVVPPSLGYGASRTDRVPPNSVLVFVVELQRAR